MCSQTHTDTHTHPSLYCASTRVLSWLCRAVCARKQSGTSLLSCPLSCQAITLFCFRSAKRSVTCYGRARNIHAPCCVSLPASPSCSLCCQVLFFPFPYPQFCIILVSTAAFSILAPEFFQYCDTDVAVKMFPIWCFLSTILSPSSSSFSYWFQSSTRLYIFCFIAALLWFTLPKHIFFPDL